MNMHEASMDMGMNMHKKLLDIFAGNMRNDGQQLNNIFAGNKSTCACN